MSGIRSDRVRVLIVDHEPGLTLTARDTPEHRTDSLAAGADDYVGHATRPPEDGR